MRLVAEQFLFLDVPAFCVRRTSRNGEVEMRKKKTISATQKWGPKRGGTRGGEAVFVLREKHTEEKIFVGVEVDQRPGKGEKERKDHTERERKARRAQEGGRERKNLKNYNFSFIF